MLIVKMVDTSLSDDSAVRLNLEKKTTVAILFLFQTNRTYLFVPNSVLT